jgi:hypothetical protein
MGKMLLGLAAAIAVTAITTPAIAGTPEEAFVGFPNVNPSVGTLGANPIPGGGFSSGGFHGGFVHHPGFGDHHGRFDRHGVSGSSNGVWVNGGQWALHNNQAFKSDSYNDWWHDRPDRAYPAWMRNNKNCERQWYAGATLRC